MARVDPELWVLAHGGYTRVYEWPPEIRWFITEEVIREFAERGLCGDDARRAVAAIDAAWAADRFPADEPSVASALQGWDYTTVDTTAESEVAEILGAGVDNGLYRDPPPAQDPAVLVNLWVDIMNMIGPVCPYGQQEFPESAVGCTAFPSGVQRYLVWVEEQDA